MHRVTDRIAMAIAVAIAMVSGLGITGRAQTNFQKSDSIDVNASGAHAIRIRTEAGNVRVIGQATGSAVQVRARLRASTASYLDQMSVRVERIADSVVVRGMFPQVGFGPAFDVAAAIDLDIIVPSSLAVDSKSTMGEVAISDLNGVLVHHGLGPVTIERIAGDATVSDDMGEVRISGIRGNVVIPSGSGHIEVRNVNGSVDVHRYGIGPLEIADVERDVHVGSMQAGSVIATHVRGNLTVEHLHAREVYSVTYNDIGGRISVPEPR